MVRAVTLIKIQLKQTLPTGSLEVRQNKHSHWLFAFTFVWFQLTVKLFLNSPLSDWTNLHKQVTVKKRSECFI